MQNLINSFESDSSLQRKVFLAKASILAIAAFAFSLVIFLQEKHRANDLVHRAVSLAKFYLTQSLPRIASDLDH